MDEIEKKRRHLLATNKWRNKNRHKVNAQQRTRRLENHERTIEHSRKSYAKNKERSKAAARNWQARNPQRVKENHSAWRGKNLHIKAAHQTARKARKLRATPKWSNDFFISEAYHLAALRTKYLGFPWHVDHIVPLKSKLVCGLHSHTNIQVIPAIQNIRKHNRYWPGMAA